MALNFLRAFNFADERFFVFYGDLFTCDWERLVFLAGNWFLRFAELIRVHLELQNFRTDTIGMLVWLIVLEIDRQYSVTCCIIITCNRWCLHAISTVELTFGEKIFARINFLREPFLRIANKNPQKLEPTKNLVPATRYSMILHPRRRSSNH